MSEDVGKRQAMDIRKAWDKLEAALREDGRSRSAKEKADQYALAYGMKGGLRLNIPKEFL